MSENHSMVSIVIPTHCRPQLLLRLLDSLASQTLSPDQFEILVVHKYTDDGTEESVQRWVEAHSVHIEYHKKNYPGPGGSRDFGARKAKGEFIAFIDDDCIASPGWLEQGIAAFTSDNVGLVQGKTLPMPGQQRYLLEKTMDIEKPSIFFETCNIFYRRKVFMEVDGFSMEFLEAISGEDTDLGWKVKRAGFDIAFCREAVVYHEVFKVSYWRWLKEPLLLFKNIHYLTKKFPELRDYMYARYFLTMDTALFHSFLLGMFVILFVDTFIGFIITGPYFINRYRNGSHMKNPFLKLMRIFFGLPRAFLMWWALVIGSIRSRNILL